MYKRQDHALSVVGTTTEIYDYLKLLFARAGHTFSPEMCIRDRPKDIEWHMIGHLQTNKIKYIAPFVALIHSVDSARLAEAIQREAAK